MKTFILNSILLACLISESAYAVTAEVQTSPATVHGSVMGIIIANDMRTDADPAQTERAGQLITMGEPNGWYIEVIMKRWAQYFNNYFYDQP